MPEPDSALVAGLRAGLEGEVLTGPQARALYAADASNYRVVPDAVVRPRTEDDLEATLALCREAGAPVTLRGAGTSMAGNAIGTVVVDVARHLNAILDLDPASGTALVQPGVVLTDLMAAAAPHGLTFGADPSSASRATLGGMIANNACGAHSLAWGTTADNVRALEVVTGAGDRLELSTPAPGWSPESRDTEIGSMPGVAGDLHRALGALGREHQRLIERQFGTFTRQISGYALQRLLPDQGIDLARLLSGSEGTLATTLRATVALVRPPAARVLLALGFPDSASAADSVPHLRPYGPLTMESINATLVDRLPEEVRRAAVGAGLPEGRVWLLVEIGGEDLQTASRSAEEVGVLVRDAGLGATASVVVDPAAQAVLWRCRRDGTGLATRRADGAEAWGGWEDAAVPPAQLGTYLRELDVLLARFGYSGSSYGHFGEGCMHIRIDFDLVSTEGIAAYRAFVEQATDLVVSLGGSVSGEHGDGRARSELVRRMYGPEAHALFTQVKRAWDPGGALNPHVIVDPLPVDRDLRHAGAAAGRTVLTLTAFPQDGDGFVGAQRRCVGVGKCLQSTGGVMCPSYRATGEEKDSTRGRAHLLWEMLEGDVITDGWRSEEVRDALDLCLSCKGCLTDCPVNVDMATYKTEFTYQHYRRRPWARPRSHWSMGWLPLSARAATALPTVANAVLGSRLAPVIKRIGGIAPERDLPQFAPRSLRRQLGARHTATGTGKVRGVEASSRGRVLLWPDTFTNYLTPGVGTSAMAVLEVAGFEVVLPEGPVCCGLTWASTGQLPTARRVLRRSLEVIAPEVGAGTPVVGLEPSCTAMLRHDAAHLLHGHPLVDRLPSAVRTLAEVLAERAPDWVPPQIGGEALVQVHCHQHAVMGFDAERALMRAAGVAVVEPEQGCCGLAGNFGFEQGHYELSQAVGERTILPAVREAGPDTQILADGFSCRTQIAQGTPRRARHLAELLAEGL
ncbi:FAD-binding oxidoreductase [Ornithinimicrobium sp. F0845]|uniref:FAD-binding and (Fe-S)-binding domain-containing protein n=1 Tax=Ornithinimicrobium sp. F0845 TaxID=2926412 RepID=UPI001FF43D5B|nr:FAD-binding and (Fe-S)-binding domain-containing protein [Ornithinimicrobium sp. F0845]MCK0111521.1 FAD-binding oxidoreductase [Ornithinimicrobium sp. F0845]